VTSRFSRFTTKKDKQKTGLARVPPSKSVNFMPRSGLRANSHAHAHGIAVHACASWNCGLQSAFQHTNCRRENNQVSLT
jgi:hypothetical protein